MKQWSVTLQFCHLLLHRLNPTSNQYQINPQNILLLYLKVPGRNRAGHSQKKQIDTEKLLNDFRYQLDIAHAYGEDVLARLLSEARQQLDD